MLGQSWGKAVISRTQHGVTKNKSNDVNLIFFDKVTNLAHQRSCKKKKKLKQVSCAYPSEVLRARTKHL